MNNVAATDVDADMVSAIEADDVTGLQRVERNRGTAAFDCSGLVKWAYEQVGIAIPRTSNSQLAGGAPVALKRLRLAIRVSPMRVDGQISGGTRRSVMSRKGYEMDTVYVQLENHTGGSFTPTAIL